jgi:hypothetical protein
MPKLILTTEAQGKVAYEFAERLETAGLILVGTIDRNRPSLL